LEFGDIVTLGPCLITLETFRYTFRGLISAYCVAPLHLRSEHILVLLISIAAAGWTSGLLHTKNYYCTSAVGGITTSSWNGSIRFVQDILGHTHKKLIEDGARTTHNYNHHPYQNRRKHLHLPISTTKPQLQ
jgi:hypothetical protein